MRTTIKEGYACLAASLLLQPTEVLRYASLQPLALTYTVPHKARATFTHKRIKDAMLLM